MAPRSRCSCTGFAGTNSYFKGRHGLWCFSLDAGENSVEAVVVVSKLVFASPFDPLERHRLFVGLVERIVASHVCRTLETECDDRIVMIPLRARGEPIVATPEGNGLVQARDIASCRGLCYSEEGRTMARVGKKGKTRTLFRSFKSRAPASLSFLSLFALSNDNAFGRLSRSTALSNPRVPSVCPPAAT